MIKVKAVNLDPENMEVSTITGLLSEAALGYTVCLLVEDDGGAALLSNSNFEEFVSEEQLYQLLQLCLAETSVEEADFEEDYTALHSLDREEDIVGVGSLCIKIEW
ncbi:hypothetical protein Goe16_02110 [Bacillus phage vB_BsuM-Goe16]|nr:hypothetical protein Goe16_00170 [Bacillus phage vB_BsuM-Goe16]WCS68625.1 hypothetical protein Goe16_02110 [Bacillus phage vB_BsuM-Goe16]